MKFNSFVIKIVDGKIAFRDIDHEKLFSKFLAQYEGKKVSLNVKDDARSDKQHRYYFLYLTMIAEETGYSQDELHDGFKHKLIPEPEFKELEFVNEIIHSRPTPSTKKLTKAEFAHYLQSIEDITGVELPDTTDFLGVSYHN